MRTHAPHEAITHPKSIFSPAGVRGVVSSPDIRPPKVIFVENAHGFIKTDEGRFPTPFEMLLDILRPKYHIILLKNFDSAEVGAAISRRRDYVLAVKADEIEERLELDVQL